MIYANGPWFTDEYGRRLILRGANLSGSSKVPAGPNGATYNLEGFFDHRNVSFVGRPFPLDEADEHFSRLRSWGLTFLRFLITWEAIEHSGPGIYDEAYLDYLRAVLIKARDHGIQVFIDPHQDVWSRFSGGDGAPGWTLEVVGFDPRKFAETGAAIVHATHGDPFPRMIWPTNATKLAAATMFTLFFAGNDFAPNTTIAGEPVQDYLQRHYIAAVTRAAERICDLDNVIGYDIINEPLRGYIGWKDLREREGHLQTGLSPTPYQSMLLGAGYSLEVDLLERRLTGIKKIGTQRVNPAGSRAWLDGFDCVWRRNGVWDVGPGGNPVLLQADYFSKINAREVEFARDYLRPFARKFARQIQAAHPGAIIFLEGDTINDTLEWSEDDPRPAAYAPHWYDAYVIYFKSFNPWAAVDARGAGRIVLGPANIRRSFRNQIAHLKNHARQKMGNIPTLIGEFGIAYDLNQRRAYASGDFSAQIRALDRSLCAMESNLVSWTIWNYTPDNSNQRGDLWNDEDFSIYSRDQRSDPDDLNSGGRGLPALLRPYPQKTAGEPLELSFDYRKRTMFYRFRHDPRVDQPTEFYVPAYQYPRGYRVSVSDGDYEVLEKDQKLIYRHTHNQPEHTVRIQPEQGRKD